MANILDIGISGLKAQQTALTITGNNITNAGTEGYSRQRVNLSEGNPQFTNGNWIGSGVRVDSIQRVYDEFITEQLRADTSLFNEFNALAVNAEQVDRLLADDRTGLQPSLEDMFDALQVSVDDPASLPAREAFLSKTEVMIDRFRSLGDSMEAQSETINNQMGVIVEQINTLSRAIAELNSQIQVAYSLGPGSEPNELLDQRDRLLKEISEYIDVTPVDQGDGRYNVLVGNGQALVAGNEFNSLSVGAAEADASQRDIYFTMDERTSNITSLIKGGQLGGILEFRDTILNPGLNELGRLALVIADTMNEQHRLGIDYDGLRGGDMFTDINQDEFTYQRVRPSQTNALPNDRVMSVDIEDVTAITASDYEIKFTGPDDYTYRIKRLSDGEILDYSALSGRFPDTVEFDGLKINFEGGSFQQGDKFTITPTRKGAQEINLLVSRAEQVALASPISTESAIGNQGSGDIDQGVVYDMDTPYFSEEGKLTPPILIRFTSPNRYDVLDNTDPGRPIPLFPPLMNQSFTPGISNKMLPEDEGKTAFTSFGGVLPSSATYQANGRTVDAVNNFFPERINIGFTNPVNGLTAQQPTLTTPENASAREIAQALSERDGVEATARTMIEISDIKEDENGFLDTELFLNGIELTDTLGEDQGKYADGYPEEVPNPLTLEFLADRINASYELRDQGIVARSDGEKLTIIDLEGDDLDFELKGDSKDSMRIGNGQPIDLVETGRSPETLLNDNEGYDFSSGGPYTYQFRSPDGQQYEFEMTENYATGEEMLQGFRDAIDQTGFVSSGDFDIDINERGQLQFQPKLEVTGGGVSGSNKFAMGGQIKVIVDENYDLSINPPGNNLFQQEPVGQPVHFGFQVKVDGVPENGDEFTIDFNNDGSSDSRNGSFLSDLQQKETVEGRTSFMGAYSRLVGNIGSETSAAQINRDSSEALLNNSQQNLDSKSGVNLDEEAAALIKHELAYNASAQVIQVARQIFDTLISTFN